MNLNTLSINSLTLNSGRFANTIAVATTRTARNRGQGYCMHVYLGLIPAAKADNQNFAQSAEDWARKTIYIRATKQMREAEALADQLAAAVNAGQIYFNDAKAQFLAA